VAHAISHDEAIGIGLGRIVQGAIDDALDALAALEQTDRDRESSIHEARKSLKLARSVMRLLRHAFGRRESRAIERRIRTASLRMSSARDADVLAGSLGRWVLVPNVDARVRRALVDAADARRPERRAVAESARAASRHLVKARRLLIERLDTFDVHAADASMLRGIDRMLGRTREAATAAFSVGSDEALHTFRKRTKDLLCTARITRRLQPRPRAELREGLDRLATRLGEDHDLAGLLTFVGEVIGKARVPPSLAAAVVRIEHRRAAIRRSCESTFRTLDPCLTASNLAPSVGRVRRAS